MHKKVSKKELKELQFYTDVLTKRIKVLEKENRQLWKCLEDSEADLEELRLQVELENVRVCQLATSLLFETELFKTSSEN